MRGLAQKCIIVKKFGWKENHTQKQNTSPISYNSIARRGFYCKINKNVRLVLKVKSNLRNNNLFLLSLSVIFFVILQQCSRVVMSRIGRVGPIHICGKSNIHYLSTKMKHGLSHIWKTLFSI